MEMHKRAVRHERTVFGRIVLKILKQMTRERCMCERRKFELWVSHQSIMYATCISSKNTHCFEKDRSALRKPKRRRPLSLTHFSDQSKDKEKSHSFNGLRISSRQRTHIICFPTTIQYDFPSSLSGVYCNDARPYGNIAIYNNDATGCLSSGRSEHEILRASLVARSSCRN